MRFVMNKIQNRVLKQDFVKWKELEWIQGDLKDLSDENFNKLHKSIKKNGIIKAFHVWENDGKIYCLDGNHLKKVLNKLLDDGDVEIPEKLKADFIHCDNMRDAEKLILIYSSFYAKITEDGLYNFLTQSGLNEEISDLIDQIEIPEMNIESYSNSWITDDFKIDEIPDVEILGDSEKQAEYVIINFESNEECDEFKEMVGLKGKNKTLAFNKLRQFMNAN